MSTGKVLALDYGEKKIGVAISDSSRQLCFIRPYIVNSGDLQALCKQVVDFCSQEGVAELIVGLPLNTDGSLSDQAKKNMEFSEYLDDALEIPVLATHLRAHGLEIDGGIGVAVFLRVVGDVLCIVEAMKMENRIVAEWSGVVSHLSVPVGASVAGGDVLCVVSPSTPPA